MKSLIYKMIVAKYAKGFDANFYLSQYDDLKSLNTKYKAFRHFIRHGKLEGRFPNEIEYLKHARLDKQGILSDFDINAYKFHNKDLLSKFADDDDFFRHYVRHGLEEGRIASFSDKKNIEEIYEISEKWKSIFKTSELLAWCGIDIGAMPSDREEAIDLFCAKGINRLWPINFEYAFDANFIRDNGLLSEDIHKSDADLYRAWLTEGFPAGVAPNEQIFLEPYLGGAPFPLSFDWQSFAQKSGMSPMVSRSQVMIALFSMPVRNIVRNIDLMGEDAARILDCIGRRALIQGNFRKAVALFEHSLTLASSTETFCLLGDAYREMGNNDEALRAYGASIEAGQAPIWAFFHIISIYVSRREFVAAFDTLRSARPFWRQKVEFGRKLHEVVQLYFDHQSARAHSLLKEALEPGSDLIRREAVDELLAETLEKIQALYLELDNLPVPMGGDPAGYVAILANDDLRQCTHYRVEQKALQFESAGIPVKIFSHTDVQGFIDCLVGARAAIFYRVAALPHILRAILHANSMNVDSYYEVDDLIFDASCYPDPFPSFEGQISATEYTGLQFGVPLFRYAMSMCKGSIASTPALAERMQVVTKTNASIVIRNGLDARNNPAITMGATPIRHDAGRVRIFYGSGTKAHNADFNRLVAPALMDLMQRYPHVDVVIVGYLLLRPELSGMGKARVITYPFISDIDAYWSVLASCAINLAVLESGVVADCKSEIKWLEAAVLQVPSVVSATKTYCEVIEDGVDGFIADSPAQWHAALERLITDPGLRAMVGGQARAKALRDYDLKVAARNLETAFGDLSCDTRPARGPGLRVLICNVFYAPQSYGGATRVVEDNIRSFRTGHPDLEIGIFCSQDGATPPGRLTMESEEGIPVYRLSTPQEVDMDWRPFNEANAEPFERVLDHFQPDIIHFHCIQRLTATIVEVALRRRIPYVVTLHDAWWISDHQFLVNEDGMLRLPGNDVLADCAERPNGLASIARRQRLTSLLQQSHANLSVSASFSYIYAQAGITGLRVVENGAPPLPAIERAPRADGRVALGHVGGRAAHKGAALIEAALRRGEYGKLHLTMVDGTLGAGQCVDTLWGTTPVTLTAPFPQARVGRLYSRLDVLLAPSTWPESFGLVTREALGAGLWVVASNLGAIGQDVDDGNGHVIDVATTAALSGVLASIDVDPARYRAAPTVVRAVRSVDHQAAELVSIYQEIDAVKRTEILQSRNKM